MNLLPDSRLTEAEGTKRMPWFYDGKWQSVEVEPVFCASCGVLHGYVPSDTTTFACWLCTKCATAYGPQLGYHLMPDEVFWKRVQEELGDGVTFNKLQALAEATWGALAKLLREKPKRRA